MVQKRLIEASIETLKKELTFYQLPSFEKIALFKKRFFARCDVYAKERQNKKGYYPLKDNYESKTFAYVPLTDEAIKLHLQGRIRLGSYAMQKSNRCVFMVIDLDDKAYNGDFSRSKALEDAQSIIESAKKFGVTLYPELSKSGKGVHLWMWFDAPILAINARRLGDLILNDAFSKTSLSLSTFDRFFPSQDFVPEDGLGNLIAVPLHFSSAKANKGTLFFDPNTLEAYENQFLFLEQIEEVSSALVYELTGKEEFHAYANESLYLPPWERVADRTAKVPLPESIDIVLDNAIYIPKKDLSKKAIYRLMQCVTFSNPDYIKAQKLKKVVVHIPRFLSAFEMDEQYLILPLGVLEDVMELFEKSDCQIILDDKRSAPKLLEPLFCNATLKEEQTLALEALFDSSERGILHAQTGFGKTLIAIALMSQLGLRTLILVNKMELLKQWVDEIIKWTGLSKKQIGTFHGSRKKLLETVDIATVQSLANAIETEGEGFIRNKYGLLLVDECHHAASYSAYQAIKAFNGIRAYGFSATLQRTDSKTPFVNYALGEVLFKHVRHDGRLKRVLECRSNFESKESEYHAIISELIVDQTRNDLLLTAIKQNIHRKILLLSDRIEHITHLSSALHVNTINHEIVHGGMNPKERALVIARLRTTGATFNVTLGTTSLLGEGMDLKNIDTLILATPISHPSRLIQILGRIGRDHSRDLLVVDINDSDKIFSKMYRKRVSVYKSLGYMFF